MSVPTLIIGGVSLPSEAWYTAQEYGVLEAGRTVHRMLNGAAVVQTHFRKLTTRISGEGWAPPALDGVDWTQAVEISCIAPRMQNSATTAATLPAARRTDVAPLARAIVGGQLVDTPLASLVGNVAAATAVAGATAYQFLYWPKLDFVSAGPVVALDAERGSYTWSLDAEEA